MKLNPRSGGFNGRELKFKDLELVNDLVQNTVVGSLVDPSSGALNTVAQGDGPSERLGRSYIVKNIHIKGNLTWFAQDESATELTLGSVTLYLVLDTQCNKATFVESLFLEDPLSSTLDMQAFRNLEYQDRFKILHTQVIEHPPAPAGAGWDGSNVRISMQSTIKQFSIYKKLNLRTTSIGTTSAVGNITDNALHLIAIRNGNNSVNINYISRIRFYD